MCLDSKLEQNKVKISCGLSITSMKNNIGAWVLGVDGVLCFSLQRHCLRENARTRQPVAPPVKQVRQFAFTLRHWLYFFLLFFSQHFRNVYFALKI